MGILSRCLSFLSAASLLSATSLPLPYHLVNQFPVGVWIENIAVRSNGDLLLTWLSPNASVVQVSDPYSANPVISIAHTFPYITSLAGIVETRPDVFVTIGGQLNLTTFEPINSTMAAFELDFSNCQNQEPTTKVLTNLAHAILPNGLTRLPEKPTTVLIGDSFGGVVFSLDTVTGDYSVAVDVPELKPVTAVGVNGLKTHRGYLYWTNTDTVEIYRVAIDGQTGSVAPGASVETVAKPNVTALDDMVFGPGQSDLLWACSNTDDRVLAVYPSGTSLVIEGAVGSITVAVNTAGAFGRTSKDSQILYVTMGGTAADPVNGTTEGGKVVAIDTTGFW